MDMAGHLQTLRRGEAELSARSEASGAHPYPLPHARYFKPAD